MSIDPNRVSGAMSPVAPNDRSEAMRPQPAGEASPALRVSPTFPVPELPEWIAPSRGRATAEGEPLATGDAVDPQVVQGLSNLVATAGAIRGEVAQPGDVDVNVEDGYPAGFPTALSTPQPLAKLFERIRTFYVGGDVLQQDRIAAWLSGASATGAAAQTHATPQLFGLPLDAVRGKLNAVVRDVREPAASGRLGADAQAAFTGFGRGLPTDINALVQWVLREAYLENMQDLAFYADKVRFYNDQKKKIRAEMKRARTELSNYSGKEGTEPLAPPYQAQTFDSTYYGTEARPGTAASRAPPQSDEASGVGSDSAGGALTAGGGEAAGGVERADAPENVERATVGGTDGQFSAALPPDVWNAEPNFHTAYWASAGLQEQVAQDLVAKIEDWIRYELSPDQREALRREWDENGLYITVQSGHRTGPYRPLHSQSLNEFIEDSVRRARENYLSANRGADDNAFIDRRGWTDGGRTPYSMSIDRPTFTTETVSAEQAEAERGQPGARGADGAAEGSPATDESGNPLTKEGLETYIKNLEDNLNTVGEDAQLANVDLQNMLQKQQQTLQMMSNISKMLHDTAMAIIRKIGS